MRIEVQPDEITTDEGGRGLEIGVPGFRHNPTETEEAVSQIYVEVYGGKLRVIVWDGSSEDPTATVEIDKADPQWLAKLA